MNDGAGAKDFHLKCDGKSSTLTIVKASQSENIFGSYTDPTWDSTSGFKSDKNAFVFGLVDTCLGNDFFF